MILILATGCLGCSAGVTREGQQWYATQSENPVPGYRDEVVIRDGERPALNTAVWSRMPSGLIVKGLQALLEEKNVTVTREEGTVELRHQESPVASPTLHRLPRVTLVARVPIRGRTDSWSVISITVTTLSEPFGCGTLVASSRVDHWWGWARTFHGAWLPWRSERETRVVTQSDASLIVAAIGERGTSSLILGGGPGEPMNNATFRASVFRLSKSGCQ